jgi:hypothetical protein
MRTTFRICAVISVLLLSSVHGFSQSKVHVFPQFVDGRNGDGSSFRSTLTIMPWTVSSSPSCTLILYGMTAGFETGATGYYFTASVPSNSVLSAPTSGKQALQAGYGVLDCSDYVYSDLILSYYAPDNTKIGEATVFSTPETVVSRMAVDVRGGVQQAFAIANNTDYNKRYVISLASGGTTRSVRVVVPARRNLAKFIHEVLPVAPDSIGVLTIQSEDLSFFSTIGFRFSGAVFTTIPGAP